MPFPTNNLPTQSKYWGREVEKKIVNLESSLKSSDINNTTRDSQLSVTANQALLAANQAQQAAADAAAAASDASDAINGLISLGSDGSTYDVAAGNITAGTVTGLNIVGGTLSTSGSRHVEISGTEATFYDNSGSFSGRVTAAEDGRAATLYAGTGASGVFMYNGGLDLEANGTVQVTGGSGLYSAGSITTSGDLGASGSVSGYSGSFTTSLSSGSLNTGSISAAGVTGSGLTSTGSITRTPLIGGGTTGASITDGGNLVRTTSSRRYKTDINPLEVNLSDVYQLEPKTFKRIDEVEERGDNARIYPGFIAEELAGTSLDKFVFYSKDENGVERPEGIHYPELTGALLIAIKDLNARIEALEAR